MSLSIHLGIHKTATTHLQQSIKLIEPELVDRDFMFLGPENMRARPLAVVGLLDKVAKKPKRAKTTKMLLRGLLSAYSNCLVSEELLLGGLNPTGFLGKNGQIYTKAENRLNNLLDLFGTKDATLFLSLRSPASFLTSAFGEALRFGGPLTPDEYFGDFDPLDLRWSDLITRLMRSGVSRLVCWRFEDLADIRHVMLTKMLGEEFAPMIPDLRPLRPGLTQAAYDMILANGRGATWMEKRKLVSEAISKYPKTAEAEPLVIFDDAIHRESDRVYAEDCAKVAAMPRVEFLRPDGFYPALSTEGCKTGEV